jgi:hypothetical protein
LTGVWCNKAPLILFEIGISLAHVAFCLSVLYKPTGEVDNSGRKKILLVLVLKCGDAERSSGRAVEAAAESDRMPPIAFVYTPSFSCCAGRHRILWSSRRVRFRALAGRSHSSAACWKRPLYSFCWWMYAGVKCCWVEPWSGRYFRHNF